MVVGATVVVVVDEAGGAAVVVVRATVVVVVAAGTADVVDSTVTGTKSPPLPEHAAATKAKAATVARSLVR